MFQVINTISGYVAFTFDSIEEFNDAFPNGITEPHWEAVLFGDVVRGIYDAEPGATPEFPLVKRIDIISETSKD